MRKALNVLAGSSPLTRGKLVCALLRIEPGRLIPAHAGKTPALRQGEIRSRAHPRSRGENVGSHRLLTATQGSSPLTRGKLPRADHRDIRHGLIPAHAGKTARLRPRGWRRRAHPRSRGENPNRRRQSPAPRGSSPLTRGKRASAHTPAGHTGLIPAHAGKTLPDLRFYCADRSDLGKP